jgi:hypothetical protein
MTLPKAESSPNIRTSTCSQQQTELLSCGKNEYVASLLRTHREMRKMVSRRNAFPSAEEGKRVVDGSATVLAREGGQISLSLTVQ